MPKATGAAGMDLRAIPKENRPSGANPTLAEIGIDKKTSSRAQKLAALPDKKSAAVLAGVETHRLCLTKIQAIAQAFASRTLAINREYSGTLPKGLPKA